MGILKDSSIVIIGIVVSNLLAYMFHIYVGRVLGPAAYGVFGALMALFLIVTLPAGAINSAVAKFTSKFDTRKEYVKIGVLRKIVSKRVWICSFILFLIIFLLSKYIASYLNIYSPIPIIVIGFTLIFALVLPINRGVLQGMKKFKIYTFNSIFESAFRLLLAVVLLWFGFGSNGALLAYGLAYFAAFLVIFPYIREVNGSSEEVEIAGVYKFMFLVLVGSFLFQLVINLPTIFVKHYASSEYTGYWNAALTLARTSLFITGGISLVMFSEISGKGEKSYHKAVFKKAMSLTLASSMLITVVFLVFGGLIIRLLYGNSYIPSLPLLEWFSVAMIPLGALQLWVNYYLGVME